MSKFQASNKNNPCPSTKIESYLSSRGLTPGDCEKLGIRHLSHREATEAYGFPRLSTSPGGIIFFPFATGSTTGIGRSWYDSKESEAAHLTQINEWRESQDLSPEKHTAKYLLPAGCQVKIYDPYLILNPDSEAAPIFATEDVIGVAKAALRGIRVLSTFGVWLGTKNDLEASQEPDWRHELTGMFTDYLADSDAIEKPQVAAAIIRTGFMMGVNIGCFPATGGEKIGFDEWLDLNPQSTAENLAAMVSENAMPVMSWIANFLPNHIDWLKERGYSDGQAVKLSSPVREAVLRELLKHCSLEDLRVDGFYAEHLKPLGLTLDVLKQKEQAAQNSDPMRGVADLIVEIVKSEAFLFHDAEKVAYADVIVDSCRHTYPLRSPEFKRWVARRLHELHDKCLNSDGYTAARTTLEALADFDGPEYKVWLRVAEHEGKLYLDLANDKWQAVEIDTQGWRIVDRPPVRFWRPSSMLPLATPTKGGDLSEFQSLMGLDGDTPEAKQAWVIIVTFWIYCLTPFGDYPVLLLVACRGSGKTTVVEFLKSTIDPGKAPLIQISGDAHKIGIGGSRRHLLCYDNVSHISPDASDILCRVATGFGHSTRTLFETDGETNFDFSRPQVITAIDHVVTRDDLADRLLMVQLPEIDKSKRLTKRRLKAKLEEMKPGILGALLTILSQALAIRETLEDKDLPRLADYGKLAIAAEQALGLDSTEEGFLKIFDKNRELSRQVVLEASPLAEAISLMVANKGRFKGTATELLKRLESYAEETTVKSRVWPKATHTLTRQLNRLKPDLAAVGIAVTTIREPGTGNRFIEVEQITGDSEAVLDEI